MKRIFPVLTVAFLVLMTLASFVTITQAQSGPFQPYTPTFWHALYTPGACKDGDVLFNPSTPSFGYCSGNAVKLFLDTGAAASAYQTPAQAAALYTSWTKHTVAVKLACVSMNTCFTVDGVEGADAAGALTQAVVVQALAAKSFVEFTTAKTGTAFAGTTTLTGKLGTTGTTNLFMSSAYNLKTAVAVTNVASGTVAGNDTAAATNLVLLFTATVDNLTALTAGSVDVWVKASVLP